MSRNIGGPVGPFNEGQSIFDFLDDKVLNQLAKTLAGYKSLTVSAPLSMQRTPHGDTIGLQKRIDNFVLCELLEDLLEDTATKAKVVRRDTTNDFVDDTSLEFEVFDSDIAVGGTTTKRWKGQRGIAFQNPFSKNATWEFLSLEIQQGGTIINTGGTFTIGCPDPGWKIFPFDAVLGSTPGLDFVFSGNGIVIVGDGPLKLNYKIYVDRLGRTGQGTDDSIEAKITVDDKLGGGFVDIPASFSIALIDDVDEICDVPSRRRKDRYEGTAACPTFFYNSLDGDVFRVEVRRKAGTETLNFPVSGDGFCSFMTFEQNR